MMDLDLRGQYLSKYLCAVDLFESYWFARLVALKGTLLRKSTWALNVDFSMKVTMVPFIWL